jgi:hypothetical protein
VTLARRRARNLIISAVLATAMLIVAGLHHLTLRDVSEASGWILVGALAVLALYNARKKLPFLPLLDSASWLQLHIYLGLLSIILFLIHTGFGLPNGGFETALWFLFAIVASSGVVGLLLSRLVPERLERHGERILFERIPDFRTRLSREVEALAIRSVTELSSTAIANYYARRLQPFFRRASNRSAHLIGYKAPVQAMVREIGGIKRYLNDAGQQILDDIEARVLAKDNLDYQETWQLVLKGWLFVHIPLTYGLLLVVVLHVLLVYGFGMGQL